MSTSSTVIRTRLKFLALVDMGQSPPSAEYSDSPIDGLPFLQGTADFGRVFPEPKIFCASPTKVAVAGAILFSVRAPVGELNIANQDVGIGRGLCSVRSGNALNDRFAWWALHEAREQLNYVSTGSTYEAVSIADVSNIRLCEEPINQQRNIAAYLDRETARLDSLVSEKERLLELLAEKQRALITHAVTRGINPNASLRDSGIPWLGKIPAHWQTRRIAWLFCERDERGKPELPLLEVSINTGVSRREFSDDRIESTAADFNTYKVARKGDVAFNKMRMWQGAVGIAPEDGLVSPDYTVATPKGALSSDYAEQLFRTEMFSAECARNSHGIVWDRLRIYWDEFRDIVVPLPPEDEQHAIVAHIASETMKLDALREAAERTCFIKRTPRCSHHRGGDGEDKLPFGVCRGRLKLSIV